MTSPLASRDLQLMTLVERETGAPPGSVHAGSRLHELGDSLTWVGLLAAVEDRYGLHIGQEQALALVTVGDLMARVEEQALEQA